MTLLNSQLILRYITLSISYPKLLLEDDGNFRGVLSGEKNVSAYFVDILANFFTYENRETEVVESLLTC